MYYSIVTICYNVLHCISMSVGQDLPDSAKRLKANLQRWPSTSSNKQQIAAVYAVCTLLCWACVAKVFFWPQPFPLSDPAAN